MATSMVATLGKPIVSSRTRPSRPNLVRCDRHVAVFGLFGGPRRMPAFVSSQRKSLQYAHIAKATTAGGGTGGWQGGGGAGGGGGGEGDDGQFSSGDNKKAGLLGSFRRGWRRRVRADPQFGFKVFSEVVIGVTACVLGDMASRPNFGLNELDFVFSTIVVGSILNFTLMYMLAPTAAAGHASKHQLPLLFATCPPGHMFEPGRYSLLDRAGTFLYKGVQFAGVGFVAGMVGTALSNLLLSVRKRVDPKFETQNQAPPTVLNALTWAGHMGVSSNARYQTLNGLEFALAGVLHPTAFKSAVFVMRGLNNVLGGVTFVMLARKTGSQTASKPAVAATPASTETPEDTLLAHKA